jgi:hypothetical protein
VFMAMDFGNTPQELAVWDRVVQQIGARPHDESSESDAPRAEVQNLPAGWKKLSRSALTSERPEVLRLGIFLNVGAENSSGTASAFPQKFYRLLMSGCNPKVLSMVVDAAAQSAHPAHTAFEMLDNLSTVHSVVYRPRHKLGFLLRNFLWQNDLTAEQMHAAAHPDRAFIKAQIKKELKSAGGTDHLAKILSALEVPDQDGDPPPLAPMTFSSAERLEWVKEAAADGSQEAEPLRSWHLSFAALDQSTAPAFLGQDLFAIKEAAGMSPALAAAYQRGIEKKDPKLVAWTNDVGIALLRVKPSLRELGCVDAIMGGLAKFSDANLRGQASQLLFSCLRDDGAAQKLEAFSARLVPRAKHFAPHLFWLSNCGELADQLPELIALVNHKRFKDGRKARPLLQFIVDIAQINHGNLAWEHKCRVSNMLAEQALPSTKATPKEKAQGRKIGVTLEMVCAAHMARRINAVPRNPQEQQEASKAKQVLTGARCPEDLAHSCKDMVLGLMAGQAGTQAEMQAWFDQFQTYLESSRAPTALLAFASNVRAIAKPDQLEAVMGEVARMARGLLANDQGATLKAMRYDTTNNEHLAMIARKAPQAWQVWQEEMQGVELAAHTAPGGAPKYPLLRACVTSQPEDMLLLGTEIANSCQSVDGGFPDKIALPAYSLDGKYLSAQITNAEGKIMSRRILRLMWSEQHQAPVVYVEREYSNPGVSPQIKLALLALIREKAQKMGVRVATDDVALISSASSESVGVLFAGHAVGKIEPGADYEMQGAREMRDASAPQPPKRTRGSTQL